MRIKKYHQELDILNLPTILKTSAIADGDLTLKEVEEDEEDDGHNNNI